MSLSFLVFSLSLSFLFLGSPYSVECSSREATPHAIVRFLQPCRDLRREGKMFEGSTYQNPFRPRARMIDRTRFRGARILLDAIIWTLVQNEISCRVRYLSMLTAGTLFEFSRKGASVLIAVRTSMW